MGDRDQSLDTYTKLAAANVLTEDLLADLERVIEIYQDADWFRLLGDVYMKNGRLPRALEMYRRALTQL
jgi:tetratricopeptide (TPR) repeat protein